VTFQEWIHEQVAKRFGTMTALATAIGMRVSPFTRGVAEGTFNVVNLLKLAQVTDEHPSKVLRLAGKAATADLIERLYGTGAGALTTSQRDLLDRWTRLEPGDHAAVEALIERIEWLHQLRSQGRAGAAQPTERSRDIPQKRASSGRRPRRGGGG
jgi:hypothetical protein